MMRAFLFAITVANAVVVTTATKTPTQAPTKSDAEISLLAECKASRTGGLSDTYTTPEATALRQEYRNGYFNFEAKLDKFDFNMEETMSDPTGADNQALATEYVMALLWSSLWPALLVFISITFFLPVTCCKVSARYLDGNLVPSRSSSSACSPRSPLPSRTHLLLA